MRATPSANYIGLGAGVILTGDNPRAAAAIAGELDLAFKAGLLPEDKVRAVTAALTNKRRAGNGGATALLMRPR